MIGNIQSTFSTAAGHYGTLLLLMVCALDADISGDGQDA